MTRYDRAGSGLAREQRGKERFAAAAGRRRDVDRLHVAVAAWCVLAAVYFSATAILKTQTVSLIATEHAMVQPSAGMKDNR